MHGKSCFIYRKNTVKDVFILFEAEKVVKKKFLSGDCAMTQV